MQPAAAAQGKAAVESSSAVAEKAPPRPGQRNANAGSHRDTTTVREKTADKRAALPMGNTVCPRWDKIDVDRLPELPASAYRPILEAAWKTVWTRHYDPTFGCVDWPSRRTFYGQAIEGVDDVTVAYATVNQMLGELGVSHLQAIPPYDARHEARPGDGRVPLRVRWLDGHVVVSDPAYMHVTSKIPGGAVLLAIDDTVLTDVTRAIRERSGPRAGTEIPNAIDELLRGAVGTQKVIRYLDPSRHDAETTTAVDCIRSPGRRIDFGHLTGLSARVDTERLADGSVGYLAFNVWMLPMLPELRAKLGKLQDGGVQALILDLRGNPGGVGAMIIPVASLLFSDPTPLGALQMRDFNQTLEARPTPGEKTFTGPVAVLIDEQTASTSEIFTVALREQGRIVVVGATPSAGMALPSLVERLPDGGLLQYAVGQYRSPGGVQAEGVGVTPDVLVPLHRSDYVAHRDPVLDAAVEKLRTSQGASP